jgi:hypothetical protein
MFLHMFPLQDDVFFDMLSCLLVVYDAKFFKLSPFRFAVEIEIIELYLILPEK